MPKVDLSGFTGEELTELIDEATSLRDTKFGPEQGIRTASEREKETLERQIDEDHTGIGASVTRL